MWNNIVQPVRPQMTLWRTRIVLWITNTKNTHSEYVTHFFSLEEKVTRTSHIITLYVSAVPDF